MGLPCPDDPCKGENVIVFKFFKKRFQPKSRTVSNWSIVLKDENNNTLGRVFKCKVAS